VSVKLQEVRYGTNDIGVAIEIREAQNGGLVPRMIIRTYGTLEDDNTGVLKLSLDSWDVVKAVGNEVFAAWQMLDK